MNILSCFDGMSCAQIALNRAGIKVNKYYASEINKYAIKVTQSNYPNTIQIGSITEWKSWNIENPDLIVAGSPCQGFSFAGKQLNFNDERSKLFFTFAEILKHYKPKYFLLENVIMKKEYNDVISGLLGEIYPECVTQNELFRTGRLEPIEINSALVSAQNRKRLYWSNIPNITQPEDRGLLLKDVIDTNIIQRKKRDIINYNPKDTRNYIQYDVSGKNHGSQSQRAYKLNCKSGTLSKAYATWVQVHYDNKAIKATIEEEEKLQTVPNNYTYGVSDIQRHSMLGNGFTVDVISHIFKGIKNANKPE